MWYDNGQFSGVLCLVPLAYWVWLWELLLKGPATGVKFRFGLRESKLILKFQLLHISMEKLILISGCYENHCENRFSDSRRISSPAAMISHWSGKPLIIFRNKEIQIGVYFKTTTKIPVTLLKLWRKREFLASFIPEGTLTVFLIS